MHLQVAWQTNLLPDLAIIMVSFSIFIATDAVLFLIIRELFSLKKTFFLYQRCLSVRKLLISADRSCVIIVWCVARHKRS